MTHPREPGALAGEHEVAGSSTYHSRDSPAGAWEFMSLLLRGCSTMAVRQLPKLVMRVRFPSPARGDEKMIRKILVCAAGLCAIIAIANHAKGMVSHHSSPHFASAAQGIAFAEQQIGAAYCYGAPTGGNCPPGTFDCSGLTYKAYNLPGSDRTSEEQWANLPHVSKPVRGDLVFFVGGDTALDPSPGHVGIYLGPHKMIDAYAVGTQVRIESFGTAYSAPGLQLVGYADP